MLSGTPRSDRQVVARRISSARSASSSRRIDASTWTGRRSSAWIATSAGRGTTSVRDSPAARLDLLLEDLLQLVVQRHEARAVKRAAVRQGWRIALGRRHAGEYRTTADRLSGQAAKLSDR